MTNEELSALILPWAKAERPDAYAKTLAVANRPDTFRRFLLRCVELRCEAEPAWMRTVSVQVLDETALSARLRHRPTGKEVTVGGRLATPTPDLPFAALALAPPAFGALLDAVDALELERT